MKQAPYTVPNSRKIRVIIDTDCACEADDQYAVAHQLMTPKFDVVGITAAHFGGSLFPEGVEESAQKSYEEAKRIVSLMDLQEQVPIYHGSTCMMKDETTPVDSEASRFIIEEALKDDDRPLFVTVQGAITNIASALLTEPRIAQRMTVIWIGGGKYPEGEWEYNACNDINAANAVMDSSVELWQVPKNVYSLMKVTFATLYERVWPCGELGKYLVDNMVNTVNTGWMGQMQGDRETKLLNQGYSHQATKAAFPGGESWQLGDSPVVGLMLLEHDGHYTVEGAPRLLPGSGAYIQRPENPRKIRVYNFVDSHFILDDFYAKIRYYFG